LEEEDWEMKAFALFPELEEEISGNQFGPNGLWDALYNALTAAYRKQPLDEDLIGRIYDYAAWCFEQPGTNDIETDLPNAVAIGLIESLPLDSRASEDLYRWLSVEAFEGFEQLFRYHLSDDEYLAFHEKFMRKKKEYPGRSRL
jgi:hypothetical protein